MIHRWPPPGAFYASDNIVDPAELLWHPGMSAQFVGDHRDSATARATQEPDYLGRRVQVGGDPRVMAVRAALFHRHGEHAETLVAERSWGRSAASPAADLSSSSGCREGLLVLQPSDERIVKARYHVPGAPLRVGGLVSLRASRGRLRDSVIQPIKAPQARRGARAWAVELPVLDFGVVPAASYTIRVGVLVRGQSGSLEEHRLCQSFGMLPIPDCFAFPVSFYHPESVTFVEVDELQPYVPTPDPDDPPPPPTFTFQSRLFLPRDETAAPLVSPLVLFINGSATEPDSYDQFLACLAGTGLTVWMEYLETADVIQRALHVAAALYRATDYLQTEFGIDFAAIPSGQGRLAIAGHSRGGEATPYAARIINGLAGEGLLPAAFSTPPAGLASPVSAVVALAPPETATEIEVGDPLELIQMGSYLALVGNLDDDAEAVDSVANTDRIQVGVPPFSLTGYRGTIVLDGVRHRHLLDDDEELLDSSLPAEQLELSPEVGDKQLSHEGARTLLVRYTASFLHWRCRTPAGNDFAPWFIEAGLPDQGLVPEDLARARLSRSYRFASSAPVVAPTFGLFDDDGVPLAIIGTVQAHRVLAGASVADQFGTWWDHESVAPGLLVQLAWHDGSLLGQGLEWGMNYGFFFGEFAQVNLDSPETTPVIRFGAATNGLPEIADDLESGDEFVVPVSSDGIDCLILVHRVDEATGGKGDVVGSFQIAIRAPSPLDAEAKITSILETHQLRFQDMDPSAVVTETGVVSFRVHTLEFYFADTTGFVLLTTPRYALDPAFVGS